MFRARGKLRAFFGCGRTRKQNIVFLVDVQVRVGFEPGENHNVDRAVLLRRFIE